MMEVSKWVSLMTAAKLPLETLDSILEELERTNATVKTAEVSATIKVDPADENFDGDLDDSGDGHGRLVTHVRDTEVTIEGPIKAFVFQGKVREITPFESWREVFYDSGRPNGVYRSFRVDGVFMFLMYLGTAVPDHIWRNGRYHMHHSGLRLHHGHHVGLHWIRKEGDSYLVGALDDCQEIDGDAIYLFPNLSRGISGRFRGGKLTAGHYGKVREQLGKGVTPALYDVIKENTIAYDPSTWMRISKLPMILNSYDAESVVVKESLIPYAGEGLFAKRNFASGELISLFNGIRINKDGCRGKIIRGDDDDDEEWSDYRLTLAEWTSSSAYCATMGHKACHSFVHKNAAFQDIYHPRFGHIMSIAALRDISAGEEILVNYNYTVIVAPLWYKLLWLDYLRSELKWSEEKIEAWKGEQVAKWGYPFKLK